MLIWDLLHLEANDFLSSLSILSSSWHSLHLGWHVNVIRLLVRETEKTSLMFHYRAVTPLYRAQTACYVSQKEIQFQQYVI